jgi:hypothetical protein
MSKLTDIITSDLPEIKNQSLNKFCKNASLGDLMAESEQLDIFRRENGNLYFRVRALFFLYAIHRFYIPFRQGVSRKSLIPFDAYEHILQRRFEEAIEIFLKIQKAHGPNEGISSGLAEAYHKLAFQTLADQVRFSVRSTLGNQWMFRTGHPYDHPLKVKGELTEPDNQSGLFPVLNESTPVRMDISHSGWSDIFFLGMDFPEGARVLNISVDLKIKDGNQTPPLPPINTYFRVIDEPVIKLTSIDLGATACLVNIDDVFDFARDYLGLLKAAIIASGIVPPGMEGSGISVSELLEKLVGTGKGFEIVSHVNNIPKGSRLAVSTNLLASLITVCMRATGQTASLTGTLMEEERRLVAARAILGEWLGGSGGGWQDSGGIWPGIKIIKGVNASKGDPEYGISNGCLLPEHIILQQDEVSASTRKKLQDSLVMVHGGMAQDVGPILEMVTEKYLLRSENEWEARKKTITFFGEVVNNLKTGNIPSIAKITHHNFHGPVQTIIPWTTNIYTEILINKIQEEFGDHFHGFWMMGGMSGGGMGFIFDPEYKIRAQKRLQSLMSETKKRLEHAVPFAMEPVVYDFSINETGTVCKLLESREAMMPPGFYNLIAPGLLKKDMGTLTNAQRNELEHLEEYYKHGSGYGKFISGLFERMMPQSGKETGDNYCLDELLEQNGFDREIHNQIKTDLKSGRIGMAQNRLPVNSKIEDVNSSEIYHSDKDLSDTGYQKGLEALKNGELAIVTLAGGIGSRWTKGAGVVKSLHPFVNMQGRHRNFIEIHLAKNRKISTLCGRSIPHVFTTSYLTHTAIKDYLEYEKNYHYEGTLLLSPGKSVGLRLIPTERELRYLWEEMPQQMLDEQAQKVQDSLRGTLIKWAKQMGEGEDYRDNLPGQCMHPVGHWYEFPNLLLNGTLEKLLKENARLNYLLIHNIDTLGASAIPGILGFHIQQNASLTAEVITRKIDDRGGGLAKTDGKIRLIEGLALPDERVEFDLTYYNTNTTWISIDKLLECFELTVNDLSDLTKVREAVRNMSRRMPTYVTIKDVKKRWGKGQEDIYPVMQFEKLWGDMTALPELNCNYMVVPRMRGQQLKEVAQLDGWLRDGSAAYVEGLCEWANL